MSMFSRSEQVDILIIYGQCNKNAAEAERVYRTEYPNRRNHPTRQYIIYLIRKMRQEPEVRDNFIISEVVEVNVLEFVNQNPTASTREIGQELRISHESARRILKKHRYRSFKYQLHQHLYVDDFERRLEYCNWFLRNNNNNNDLVFSI